MSYSQKSTGSGNSGGGSGGGPNNQSNQQAAKGIAGIQQQLQNLAHVHNALPQATQGSGAPGLNHYTNLNMYNPQSQQQRFESLIKQQQQFLLSNPQLQQHLQQMQQNKEPLALTRTPGAAELLNKSYQQHHQQQANGGSSTSATATASAAAASIATNLAVNQQFKQQLQAITQNPNLMQQLQAYQYQIQQQQHHNPHQHPHQQQQQQQQQQHPQLQPPKSSLPPQISAAMQAQNAAQHMQQIQQMQHQQHKYMASHSKASSAGQPGAASNPIKPPNLPSSTQITPIPTPPQLQSNNNVPAKGPNAKQPISPSVSLLPAKPPLQHNPPNLPPAHPQTAPKPIPMLTQSPGSVVKSSNSPTPPPISPQLQPKVSPSPNPYQSQNPKPVGLTKAFPLSKPAGSFSPARPPPANVPPHKAATLPPMQTPPKATSPEIGPRPLPMPLQAPPTIAQMSLATVSAVKISSTPPKSMTPVEEPAPVVTSAKSNEAAEPANVVPPLQSIPIPLKVDKVEEECIKVEEPLKIETASVASVSPEASPENIEQKDVEIVTPLKTDSDVASNSAADMKDIKKTEHDADLKPEMKVDAAIDWDSEEKQNKEEPMELDEASIKPVSVSPNPERTEDKDEQAKIASISKQSAEKEELSNKQDVTPEPAAVVREKPAAKTKPARQAKPTVQKLPPKSTPVKEKPSRPAPATVVTPAILSTPTGDSDADRKTKRHRLKTILYQSPLPELAYITKLSASEASNSPKPVVVEDKLIVFYKSEYMAVRNADGGFFLCQTMQNVYKSSPKIRIRWLSEQKEGVGVYIPDFYDHTDIECVLTTVELRKAEKSHLRLPDTERVRIENILKKAIDVESGKLPRPNVTEENPDGLDISLYKDESQIEKKRVQVQNSNSKTLLGKRKQSKSKSPKKKKKKTTSKSKKSANTSGSEDESDSNEDDDDFSDSSEDDVEYKPNQKRGSAATQPKVRAQRSPLAKARAASPITPTTSRSSSSVPQKISTPSTSSRNDRAKRRAVDPLADDEVVSAKKAAPSQDAVKKSTAEKSSSKNIGETITSSSTPKVASSNKSKKNFTPTDKSVSTSGSGSSSSSSSPVTSPTGRPIRNRK